MASVYQCVRCKALFKVKLYEGNKSLSAPPAPTATKRKRSNVSEVLDVFKEHIALQDKRHEENMKKQDEMHNERMAAMKGFLEVFKDMST